MTAIDSTGLGDCLLIERDGCVVNLTFNRPAALNAIDVSTACALRDAAKTLSADRSIRAIVFAGSGRAFIAGGDLLTLSNDPITGANALLEPLNEAVSLFSEIDAPVIAKVHGVVAGAGMSLMMLADFVIAAEETKFNFAYINIGASCDVGASWMLPRLVGLRRAFEISMLGGSLSVNEAEHIGLVNRVVPRSELDVEVKALAEKLASGPTLALGNMRRLMRNSFENDLVTQLALEKKAFLDCVQTRDFKTGVNAFLEKRVPQFLGN